MQNKAYRQSRRWTRRWSRYPWLAMWVVLLALAGCSVELTSAGPPQAPAAPIDAAATIPTLPAAPADRQSVEPGPTPQVGAVALVDAPGELAAVNWPDSEEDVRALLAQLPGEIDGYARTPQYDLTTFERILIGYGEDTRLNPDGTALLQIQAIDATSGDFFPPNWRAQHIVMTLAQGRALEQGQDGDLFWAYVETDVTPTGSTQSYTLRSLTWGERDGEWIFSVNADSREGVDALVAALVAAARD